MPSSTAGSEDRPVRLVADQGAIARQIEAARKLQAAVNKILDTAPFEPPVVGLGGYLRSGKDTLADHLVSAHGFKKIGMSDPLAHALYTLNPFIPGYPLRARDGYLRYQEHVDAVGYTAAKENPEVRRLLQVLGTEVGRDMISPNVWTDIAERTIKKHREDGHPVVLTGVRFINELRMIDRLGTSVWVARNDAERENTTSHASEATLTSADFQKVIVNEGSLAELYRAADQAVAALNHRGIDGYGQDYPWPVYDR